MKRISILVSFLICFLLIVQFVLAENDSKATKWLSKEQEEALVATVPPPPAVDSPEDKADYAAMLAAQNGRTPEIIAECKHYQSFGYKLFEDIYGKELTDDRAPKFQKLMKTVLETTRVINDNAKEKYRRLRPYQEHRDTVHALFAVGGYSYPSGHSMGSFTLAVVLGAVFPDKQQAFLDRAAQIAQSRVSAGVHNPSDIKEGEVVGKATGAAILASPAFQADLAEVKAELAK